MGFAAKKIRVDYSPLVGHLQRRQTKQANEMLEELLPKLEGYLCVTMGADESTAKECVHQAFLNVYERILGNKIRDSKSILSYLMQTSRNEYINHINSKKRFRDQPLPDYGIPGMVEPADQINNLIDKERMEALEFCLHRLDEESRHFIEHFLNNPGVSSKDVGKFFGISEANVRTRKSRLVKQLHHLYRMVADQ